VVSGDIFISRISRRGKRVRVANARCVTHVHEDVDGTSKGGLSIRATCQYVIRLNIKKLYPVPD